MQLLAGSLSMQATLCFERLNYLFIWMEGRMVCGTNVRELGYEDVEGMRGTMISLPKLKKEER
jgi:hypothetical protein